MRLAAIYDIHGNLPALEAVLAAIREQGVDRVVVGGDVTLGPMPRRTLEALDALEPDVDYLVGNGELAQRDAANGVDFDSFPAPVVDTVRWTVERIGPRSVQRFAEWPRTIWIEHPELGSILFCHATPRDENEIFTARTAAEDLLPILADCGASLVVCGHTHMQFDRTVGATRVVNAGSVGMPFGEPGAHWLLLGPGSEVEHRRTPYDLAAAAERIRETDCPQADELAAGVLRPRSEEEMLALFAGDRSD